MKLNLEFERPFVKVFFMKKCYIYFSQLFVYNMEFQIDIRTFAVYVGFVNRPAKIHDNVVTPITFKYARCLFASKYSSLKNSEWKCFVSILRPGLPQIRFYVPSFLK